MNMNNQSKMNKLKKNKKEIILVNNKINNKFFLFKINKIMKIINKQRNNYIIILKKVIWNLNNTKSIIILNKYS